MDNGKMEIKFLNCLSQSLSLVIDNKLIIFTDEYLIIID